MIVIVPYDAGWPAQFESEARRIAACFGAEALRIEHVGSTSVPGLASKPVIDIQVSVSALDRRELHLGLMRQLGYTHFALGEFDRVYPFFKRPETWPSTHHVHLCEAGSEQERMHLQFRDYLRQHPPVAAEYEALKRLLASRFDGLTLQSQEGFSLAKGDFVRRVLQEAGAVPRK